MWAIQARSIASRRTNRIKSVSSWNSYQKSSWDGRIQKSSRITSRWIFEKKIDRKSGHYAGTTGMKLIVWMIREFLRMPSQCAVDHPTFPVNQRYFHPVDPGGMLSRKDKPPDIWDTHGISGNVFVNPRASSSSPYPGGFSPWILNVTEDTPVVTSTGGPVTSDERQMPDTALIPRCHTGPSAGKFSRP